MKYLILVLTLLSTITFAKDPQTEQWFTRIGVGYILDQPDDIKLTTTTDVKFKHPIEYGDYYQTI